MLANICSLPSVNMNTFNLHIKITLALSLLVLNNYFFLSLNISPVFIKINLILFFLTILFFYFKNILDNPFLKIFFIFIVFISLGSPLFEWDARSIWLFHAKRIFFENSIFVVADNYADFSHNEYPSLAPALAASFATLVGHWNEVFPKVAFTFMFLPPLILIYSFLKSTHYVIFLSIVFFTIGKYLYNGWADGLVAVYFGLSAFLMYLLILSDDDNYKKKFLFYFIALSFFSSLTLIKNEGSALLFILFAAASLITLYESKFRENIFKLLILSISFLPIILWKYFNYNNGIVSNDYININILSNLLPRLDDFNNYKLIAEFLLLNEKFLISLIFLIISFCINQNKKLFSFVSITIVTYIVILFVVYLSTPLDFRFQLDSTATRVVKSPVFLMAFFGLYNLKDYNLK